MKSQFHPLAFIAAVFSWIGTLTPSDLAHLAAAFSGVCAGIYYAAQAAAFIRDKFLRPPAPAPVAAVPLSDAHPHA